MRVTPHKQCLVAVTDSDEWLLACSSTLPIATAMSFVLNHAVLLAAAPHV